MARRSPKDGAIKIDDRVFDLLMQLAVEGDLVLRHPDNLDRKDYLAMNEVLEALGGKWSRSRKGHAFPGAVDNMALIEGAMFNGEVVKDPHAGDFFQTPNALALELAERAEISFDDTVLEPSAGEARLALACRRMSPDATIVTCEADPDRRRVLEGYGFPPAHLHVHDFLQLEPRPVDRIVMNPPFSRGADVAHVAHALRFLRPRDAALVAVMSPAIMFRTDPKTTALRDALQQLGAEPEWLPDQSFAASGTGIRTCLVEVHT